jgi:hypothetical protein
VGGGGGGGGDGVGMAEHVAKYADYLD